MSARRKASCAKTRLHYGFVTPRRRTQRAGADLSSTVQPGSISNPFGSGLHLSRRRPATPAANLSAVPGLPQAATAEPSLAIFSRRTTALTASK